MSRVLVRLVLFVLTMAGVACAQDLTGNWQGTLQNAANGGNGIRAVLKVTKDDGRYKGTVYFVDQPGASFSLATLTLDGKSVQFTIKAPEVSYAGTLSPEGSAIAGKATLNGQANELDLQKVSEENTWAIPKPPKPMAADAKPKFEVVTIKPSDPDSPGKLLTIRGRHIVTINTNMNDLVTFAYGLHAKQIVGAPEWFATEKFDLDGVPDVDGQPNSDQFRMLIQDALTDRFNLTFHRDKRELAVYALTVAKGGPKLTVTQHEPSDPRNFLFRGLGKLVVTNSTMQDVCKGFQGAVMDKPVVDQTGLKDRYDFTLNWTPDDSQFLQMGRRGAPPTQEDPNPPPSLYTALQEQLGLKLDAAKAPTDVIVIDHVEKPGAN